MNNKKRILIGILLFFLIGFAYSEYSAYKKSISLIPPAGSVENNGEFYVYITGINNNVLDLKHITYFSGTEAFLSAEKEAGCDKDSVIECVPTLKNGYYVRESGAPDFKASLAEDAKILLSYSKPESASVDDLIKEINISSYRPVFKVDIKNGSVISVEEVTRYNTNAGLPKGYSFDSYRVAKITDTSCKIDNDCQTPAEYLLLSSCPYTSICEKSKCTIICPDPK